MFRFGLGFLPGKMALGQNYFGKIWEKQKKGVKAQGKGKRNAVIAGNALKTNAPRQKKNLKKNPKKS